MILKLKKLLSIYFLVYLWVISSFYATGMDSQQQESTEYKKMMLAERLISTTVLVKRERDENPRNVAFACFTKQKDKSSQNIFLPYAFLSGDHDEDQRINGKENDTQGDYHITNNIMLHVTPKGIINVVVDSIGESKDIRKIIIDQDTEFNREIIDPIMEGIAIGICSNNGQIHKIIETIRSKNIIDQIDSEKSKLINQKIYEDIQACVEEACQLSSHMTLSEQESKIQTSINDNLIDTAIERYANDDTQILDPALKTKIKSYVENINSIIQRRKEKLTEQIKNIIEDTVETLITFANLNLALIQMNHFSIDRLQRELEPLLQDSLLQGTESYDRAQKICAKGLGYKRYKPQEDLLAQAIAENINALDILKNIIGGTLATNEINQLYAEGQQSKINDAFQEFKKHNQQTVGELVKLICDGKTLQTDFTHSEQLLFQWLNDPKNKTEITEILNIPKDSEITMHIYTTRNPCSNCAFRIRKELKRKDGFINLLPSTCKCNDEPIVSWRMRQGHEDKGKGKKKTSSGSDCQTPAQRLAEWRASQAGPAGDGAATAAATPTEASQDEYE